MKTKVSYGIALCRQNKGKNNAVEILLIKKRYSYAYQSFVMQHYSKNDTSYIRYLFDQMSFGEKIDILGMQFCQMWQRIWLNNPEKFFNLIDVYKSTNFSKRVIKSKFSDADIHKLYREKKNKFENNFLKDGGEKLRQVISQSKDAEILWEIPKGKKSEKNNDETNIDCAIREFYEETSISSDKYKILYDVDPLIDSFVDNSTKYKTVYYIATLNKDSKNYMPHIDFRNFEQISEVEQIKWVSIDEIKFFNLPKSMNDRLYYLYKYIIKMYKKNNRLSKLII